MTNSEILSIAHRTCREYRHDEECKYRFDDATLIRFVDWVNSKSTLSIKDKLSYLEDNYVITLESDIGSWHMVVTDFNSAVHGTYGWLEFDACITAAYEALKDD